MMNKTQLTSILTAVTFFSLVSCGSGENQNAATENGGTELAAIDHEHKYICPMHCENSGSNEPGQCPVCGMDLVANPDYTGTDAKAEPGENGNPKSDSTSAGGSETPKSK